MWCVNSVHLFISIRVLKSLLSEFQNISSQTSFGTQPWCLPLDAVLQFLCTPSKQQSPQLIAASISRLCRRSWAGTHGGAGRKNMKLLKEPWQMGEIPLNPNHEGYQSMTHQQEPSTKNAVAVKSQSAHSMPGRHIFQYISTTVKLMPSKDETQLAELYWNY